MIVDTMVFVYALLKVEDKCEEAIAVLEKADRIVVPDSFRAELTNAVWQWVKLKDVSEEVAFGALQRAEALVDRVVSSEEVWIQALRMAITSDHAAYDTLFVATAVKYDEKVVTYDKKLRSKFPSWVLSPQAFLAL